MSREFIQNYNFIPNWAWGIFEDDEGEGKIGFPEYEIRSYNPLWCMSEYTQNHSNGTGHRVEDE